MLSDCLLLYSDTYRKEAARANPCTVRNVKKKYRITHNLKYRISYNLNFFKVLNNCIPSVKQVYTEKPKVLNKCVPSVKQVYTQTLFKIACKASS